MKEDQPECVSVSTSLVPAAWERDSFTGGHLRATRATRATERSGRDSAMPAQDQTDRHLTSGKTEQESDQGPAQRAHHGRRSIASMVSYWLIERRESIERQSSNPTRGGSAAGGCEHLRADRPAGAQRALLRLYSDPKREKPSSGSSRHSHKPTKGDAILTQTASDARFPGAGGQNERLISNAPGDETRRVMPEYE